MTATWNMTSQSAIVQSAVAMQVHWVPWGVCSGSGAVIAACNSTLGKMKSNPSNCPSCKVLMNKAVAQCVADPNKFITKKPPQIYCSVHKNHDLDLVKEVTRILKS